MRNTVLDNDDQQSFRDMFLDHESNNVVTESLQAQEGVQKQVRSDSRFTEINRQISGLSSLVRELAPVLTLVAKGQPVREEKGLYIRVDNPF